MKNARKKIFLGWNGHQKYAVKAIELFRERGYDTTYVISTDEDGVRIPGVIFHDKIQSERGFPAEGIDPSAFPPPEADAIRALYKVESLALTMDRLPTSVDEKKRLYHELLRYWKGVLDAYKPDCIVLSCFPHHLGMFILYSIGREMGIPTIFIHETFAAGRLVFQYDYEKSPPLLAARFEENKKNLPSVESLPNDLRTYYEMHRSGVDAAPSYMKDLAQWFSVGAVVHNNARIILHSLVDGSFLKRMYHLFGRIGKQTPQQEFERLVTKPDLSVPFVYVPLQVQPETSTSPLGDVFADQILELEILSHALPKGWLLYVKENPYQFQVTKGRGWSPVRRLGYYQKIIALGNTRLVPLDTNSFTLIKNSRAVASITGTALREAALRGKPALLFGYPWFMDMPGLLRVSGPKSAREAFGRIQQGFLPDQKQVVAFLKSLDEASILGSLERLVIDENVGVSREETVPRVVDFLAEEMDKMLR